MRHVAVFARWPRPGTVKTRLHPVLGAEGAARLHDGMLRDALAAAGGAARADRRHLFWADPPPGGLPARVGFDAHIQSGDDLGARLERAFEELLSARSDHAVVIGADCPRLDAALVDQALAALVECDVVIGPARDGGYYLLGLSRRRPELFRDISWSTAAVRDQTLARAAESRARVRELPALDDLDDAESLLRFVRFAAREPDGARDTRTELRQLGLLP